MPLNSRTQKKHKAYADGLKAEQAAKGYYDQVLAQRYRSEAGEIDLVTIAKHAVFGDILVFAEVKKRKTLEDAAYSLQPKQLARIASSAECWLADNQDYLGKTCRFDVVLMDEQGQTQIIENAWMS